MKDRRPRPLDASWLGSGVRERAALLLALLGLLVPQAPVAAQQVPGSVEVQDRTYFGSWAHPAVYYGNNFDAPTREEALAKRQRFRNLQRDVTVAEFLGGSVDRISIDAIRRDQTFTQAKNELIDTLNSVLFSADGYLSGPSFSPGWAESTPRLTVATVRVGGRGSREAILGVSGHYLFVRDQEGTTWWHRWGPQPKVVQGGSVAVPPPTPDLFPELKISPAEVPSLSLGSALRHRVNRDLAARARAEVRLNRVLAERRDVTLAEFLGAPVKSVDILFLDAGHTLESASNELRAALAAVVVSAEDPGASPRLFSDGIDEPMGYTVAVMWFDPLQAQHLDEQDAEVMDGVKPAFAGFLGVRGRQFFFQDAFGATWWFRH